MKMESFQVDIILSSLKELQQEKLRKEKVLAEEYGKRKQLEAKLEAVTTKHTTASEKNAKMKEVMKVAERKVAQAQAQVKLSEQLTNDKREKIAELNRSIATEEERKQIQLNDLETKMTALTDKFRSANHFYSETSLDSEITHCEEQKRLLSSKAAENESKLKELSSKLQELRVKQNTTHPREVISVETWRGVLDMFRSENKASQLAVVRSQERLPELQEERNRLLKELEGLQVKMTHGGSHEE